MQMIRYGFFATAALLVTAGMSVAQTPPEVQRGRVLADTYCAMCHSIDKVGASPLSISSTSRSSFSRATGFRAR